MTFFPSRQVALELWGFSLHWYGILYLIAFVAAYVLIKKLQSLRNLDLDSEEVSSLLSAAILGVIIGGRLGFVMFYEPEYFLSQPLEIFMVWKGGMSSHGGFLGVSIALGYTLWKRRVPFLPFLDVITVPIALGLALGRVGNFINLELYGTVTSVAWATAIPGVEGLRHPTFFYAIAKNLFIGAVCLWHLRAQAERPGTVFALFLMLYGALRFAVEYFRDQPYGGVDLFVILLTRGQLLSIPIVLIGFGLMIWVYRK